MGTYGASVCEADGETQIVYEHNKQLPCLYLGWIGYLALISLHNVICCECLRLHEIDTTVIFKMSNYFTNLTKFYKKSKFMNTLFIKVNGTYRYIGKQYYIMTLFR